MLRGTSNLLAFFTPVRLPLIVLSPFSLVPGFSMIPKGQSLGHTERTVVWCLQRLCACSMSTLTVSPGRHVAPFMCHRSTGVHCSMSRCLWSLQWLFDAFCLHSWLIVTVCTCFHLMDQGLQISPCKTVCPKFPQGLANFWWTVKRWAAGS